MSDTAPRPRVIERWFPCAEVSAASSQGWGSSNAETGLFPWFAKRPLAQSRAAVLCSLIPWPDSTEEQSRVQAIIRESLGTCVDPDYAEERNGYSVAAHAFGIQDCARFDRAKGYGAARKDVLELLQRAYPDGASTLDPFSGRGLIPIESVRYGVKSTAIDYSPVATLASSLLIDYPFREWDNEPSLPFDGYDNTPWLSGRESRICHDVAEVNREVERLWLRKVSHLFPRSPNGELPWGYLWVATIPCEECGRLFPLYGSNVLMKPGKGGSGQSFELSVEQDGFSFRVVEGVTVQEPTARSMPGKRGKLAWCPRPECGHGHPLASHTRIYSESPGRDVLVAVADVTTDGKRFREPTSEERRSVDQAAEEIENLVLPTSSLPARPSEGIPPANSSIIVASIRGAKTMGDLFNERQNLTHAWMADSIAHLGNILAEAGLSDDYRNALLSYASASFVKKLKYSSRGARLYPMANGGVKVDHIFVNEGVVGFNYDYFEVGIGEGPGSWKSVSSTSSLRRIASSSGRPSMVQRASALSLPVPNASLDAVVTDPPYDMMIAYSDASDVFFVWLKRALGQTLPEFAMTSDVFGLQEKAEEIIVKKNFESWDGEHRRPELYDSNISLAFSEMRRTVKDDGVVSIVFGHGEPEVWKRLLTAIERAGLVLTGSWPAQTEKGGSAGSANIVTTLTLACRPAPPNRPDGSVAVVDAEVRRVVADRVRNLWDPAGLAVDDQLMAAAGPAMEVVGRYGRVLDKTGKPVDISRYLPLARRAVEDAQDIRLDSLPLATFDTRTRFGLFWARLHGRRVQAASEARWQRLASDMEEHETAGVLTAASKGVRLAYSDEAAPRVEDGSPIFDVALAAAHEWRTGSLADAASMLRASGRDPDDPHLWACINALSKALPETDKDGEVFTRMVRNRESVVAAARNVEAAEIAEAKQVEQRQQREKESPRLFEDPNSLFGQEGL